MPLHGCTPGEQGCGWRSASTCHWLRGVLARGQPTQPYPAPQYKAALHRGDVGGRERRGLFAGPCGSGLSREAQFFPGMPLMYSLYSEEQLTATVTEINFI